MTPAKNSKTCLLVSERAIYPIGAWCGTLLEEYCDLCGDGNFIPKKFFAEALVSHICAILGTKVQSRVGGALSHSVTIFISVTQTAKGVSIEERVNQLFWSEGESTTLEIPIPLIWNATRFDQQAGLRHRASAGHPLTFSRIGRCRANGKSIDQLQCVPTNTACS